MKKTMFSIILPIYNRREIFPEAVKSVCDQRYKNWELLLVDDGSTDGTELLCKKYSNLDNRIRYISGKHRGVCTARNIGLSKAKGEYLLFLDSDNSLMPDALTVLNDKFIDSIKADLICFGYNSTSDKRVSCCQEENGYIANHEEIWKKILPTHLNIYTQEQYFLQNYVWNKCYRVQFLRDNKLIFDEERQLWEDGLYVVNCLAVANLIKIIPDVLYNAYSFQKSEHLSEKLFLDQILQYLNDETMFRERFSSKIDFQSEHYCESNFNVLKNLLRRTIDMYEKDAEDVVSNAIRMPIVTDWIKGIHPNDKLDCKLCDYIFQGNVNGIYHLYHQSTIKSRIRTFLFK